MSLKGFINTSSRLLSLSSLLFETVSLSSPGWPQMDDNLPLSASQVNHTWLLCSSQITPWLVSAGLDLFS